MTGDVITSAQNALIKRIRRLGTTKGRRREAATYVEGIRIVVAALDAGLVERVVWSGSLLTSAIGRAAVERAPAASEISADLFRALSARENPMGLAAIVRPQAVALPDLPLDPSGVYAALCDVAQPGNLGTVIRTADSAGATAVIAVGQTADWRHPRAIKAAMGASFRLPLAHCASAGALLAWARSHGLHTIATSAHAPHDYRRSYPRPALLLMGSERHGLPESVLAAADIAVSIPMRGVSSSLNLAVATGLMLYEILR